MPISPASPGRTARRPRVPGVVALLVALLVATSAIPPTSAQDRSTVVRVLRESRDFRARVRAAAALGASGDPAMAGPLVGALLDDSAAVRAAAADALGRLGSADALPSLRRALRDRERGVRDAADRAIRAIGTSHGTSATAAHPPTHDPLRMPSVEVLPREREVDWRTTRYVVLLGEMANRSGFGNERLQSVLSQEVHRHLLVLRGVAALPALSPDAEREITRRRLPRMRLEGSITRVHRQAHGREVQVRCEVSLMLLDDPGRSIRAALNGAATGMERASSARATQEARLAEQALQGAVRSAMSGAARAITASGR